MYLKKVATLLLMTIISIQGSQIVTHAATESILSGSTAFAHIEDYTTVHNKADETSESVGKFYDTAKATILEEEGDWYKILSGTVEGYVPKNTVITGKEAMEFAKQAGNEVATVEADVLSVRQQPNTTSDVIEGITKDSQVQVLNHLNGWLYVEYNGVQGYISKEYADTQVQYKTAESLQEEQVRIEKERLEQEAQKRAAVRTQLVAFALQYVGNPYVYGGTSLTNGTDCSGFTQSVYSQFGYQLPRTSREQDNVGTEISAEQLQPGDLIFYAKNGSINHVALYIGEGQVVHASSPKTGIKVSNYDYRQPEKFVSIL